MYVHKNHEKQVIFYELKIKMEFNEPKGTIYSYHEKKIF